MHGSVHRAETKLPRRVQRMVLRRTARCMAARLLSDGADIAGIKQSRKRSQRRGRQRQHSYDKHVACRRDARRRLRVRGIAAPFYVDAIINGSATTRYDVRHLK